MIEKNLTEFEHHSEYIDFTGSTIFSRPNISYCDDRDEVHYTLNVTGITLNESEFEVISSQKHKLKATVLPLGAFNQNVTWSSSDESIATVDENGLVTAVALSGSCVITVTTEEGGFSKQCVCNVDYIRVTGVTLNETEIPLYEGGTFQLYATVVPDDANIKTVTWSSSDDEIATVTQDGFVEGVGFGYCDITVKTDDGDHTATCRVKIDPAEDYLTFIPDTARTFKFSPANSNVVEYSVNAGNDWTSINDGEETPTVEAKKKILWRCNAIPGTNIGKFVDDVKTSFKVQGNAMSMIYGDNFNGKTDMKGNQFQGMFAGCRVTAANGLALPAESVPSKGYFAMFSGCTQLSSAPELPATSIGTSGYSYMFYDTILSSAQEELPLETIPEYGCYWMFRDSSLKTLPRIVATTVNGHGLESTFAMTRITSIPNGYLSSPTTLGINAYTSMFYSCESLTTVPEDLLPVTTLPEGVYSQMFRNCTKLTVIPDLPAEIVPSSAYRYMFEECTSLTSFDASKIHGNAFTGNYACNEMFCKCTKITAITNSLSFTSVGIGEFKAMFSGCTKLASVSDDFLPQVTSIGNEGYAYMFSDCSVLTGISVSSLPATTVGVSGYQGMFKGCKLLGETPNLPATSISASGYGEMFQDCTSLTVIPTNLLPATGLSSHCYYSMFGNCTNITNVPTLPSTKMEEYCYGRMFMGCKSIVNVPSDLLPAVGYRRALYPSEDGIYDGCYSAMFSGCTSLENAPDLETLDYFYSETSPTSRDHRNRYCYSNMFNGCSSLKYIRCLGNYRRGDSTNTNECGNNPNPSQYTCNWVKGVAASGTFVYRDGVNWWSTDSGCPAGWTKVIDGQQ